jgi:hypothetical protein
MRLAQQGRRLILRTAADPQFKKTKAFTAAFERVYALASDSSPVDVEKIPF